MLSCSLGFIDEVQLCSSNPFFWCRLHQHLASLQVSLQPKGFIEFLRDAALDFFAHVIAQDWWSSCWKHFFQEPSRECKEIAPLWYSRLIFDDPFLNCIRTVDYFWQSKSLHGLIWCKFDHRWWYFFILMISGSAERLKKQVTNLHFYTSCDSSLRLLIFCRILILLCLWRSNINYLALHWFTQTVPADQKHSTSLAYWSFLHLWWDQFEFHRNISCVLSGTWGRGCICDEILCLFLIAQVCPCAYTSEADFPELIVSYMSYTIWRCSIQFKLLASLYTIQSILK